MAEGVAAIARHTLDAQLGSVRMIEGAEHYPLATLAVAAGIGFLLGSARK